MPFPQFDDISRVHDLTAPQNLHRMLEKIQYCTSLRSIEFTLGAAQELSFGLGSKRCDNSVMESLALINTRLREIRPLQKILVMAKLSYSPNAAVQRTMESHGWEVIKIDG